MQSASVSFCARFTCDADNRRPMSSHARSRIRNNSSGHNATGHNFTSTSELSVGPISSIQPIKRLTQLNPQPNQTPYYQQQTFGTRKTILCTLFHRNIMTVSKTSVNKYDIVSNIPLSVEVYQVSLASVNFWKFLRPTTQPYPTRGSTQLCWTLSPTRGNSLSKTTTRTECPLAEH